MAFEKPSTGQSEVKERGKTNDEIKEEYEELGQKSTKLRDALSVINGIESRNDRSGRQGC